MKKRRCEECLRCASTPNEAGEYDGYCMEMEIVVDVRDEACTLAEFKEEEVMARMKKEFEEK